MLVRGGTTSVGLTAATIAWNKDGTYGCGMTRRKESKRLMRRSGMDGGFFDDGHVAGQIKSVDEQFDKVLELTATTTLRDSLRWTKSRGQLCLVGTSQTLWYSIGCAETCLMSAYSRSCPAAISSIGGT